MWTESSTELRTRWRSGSYDFEAGGESSSLSPHGLEQLSPRSEKGHYPRRGSGNKYRSFSSAKLIAIFTALLALIVLFVLVASRRSIRTEYVSRAAHESRCESLRDELGSATTRTQSIVKMRREGRPLNGVASSSVTNDKPLQRVPKSAADAMLAIYSDWALKTLGARVDRARREEKRQRQLSIAIEKETLCDLVPPREGRLPEGSKIALRAVSLNLWQPAADSWPQRKKAMAKVLAAAEVDLIACQEVRGFSTGNNWAQELAAELPNMIHVEYIPGTGGAGVRGGRAPNGWTEEGVAIISRFPLSDIRAVGMPPSARSSDRNPRTTLAATVHIPTPGKKRSTVAIRVIASHLSYDRNQQCDAVRDKLKPWLDTLLNDDHKKNPIAADHQLLLGDLNVYPDFEWPADILTKPQALLDAMKTPCWTNRPLRQMQDEAPAFIDLWEQYTGSGDPILPDSIATSQLPQRSIQHLNTYNPDGWTFPNPESLNLDAARPDRMLFRAHPNARNRLRPATVAILGCNTVLKANQQTTRPSDHRILLSDFVAD